MSTDRAWWKEAVVYQLYPRSFNDASGDGVGDLLGLVEKIDYLDDLGVDVVWLNPVYDSPLVDEGYDVRDYHAILDEYGSMVDWEVLRNRLHDRGIQLIMDLVVNHTSNEHEWFERSRRGKGKYRDYYWWVDAPPARPPNNWESFFGGPAWTYDHQRGAWYLHLFDEKQPDLNWRNPAVREEVYEMMRWWLEKDVDGFRMDVINLLSKPADLPDGDPDADLVGQEHFIDGPRLHEYLREMDDRVLSEYDVVTVGEAPQVTVEEARQLYDDGLDMVFPFQHLNVDRGDRGPWDVRDWDLDDLREVVTKWQRGLGEEAWNSVFLGNHDQPRMVSRFGDDGEYRRESAKMLATFLFTLQGTPFVYQGDEIGMTNPTFHDIEEFRDIQTIGRVETALAEGEIESVEEIHDELNYWSRDNARTPMQWSDGENAGFSTGEPWIKVSEDYPEVNVERERDDEGSVLSHYRRLIDRRGDYPLLVYGHFEPILEDHGEILAYLRTPGDEPGRVDGSVAEDGSVEGDREAAEGDSVDGASEVVEGDSVGEDQPYVADGSVEGGRTANEGRPIESDDPARFLVVLNFSDGEPTFALPDDVEYDDAELVIGSYETDTGGDLPTFDLRPYESRVYGLVVR